MKKFLPITIGALAAFAAVAWGQPETAPLALRPLAAPVVGPAPAMPVPARVTTPPGIKVETIATGLTVPWGLAFTPDGRTLVTERGGRVRLIRDGQLQTAAYITLSPSRLGEGGLMGIALAPGFPNPPNVYVMYTAVVGQQKFNRVSRFTDRGTSAITEQIIVDRIPAGTFHDGGGIAFGPDGMLYIGTGDAQNPPLAQDRNSLAGKILRVTPTGAVPGDNPFPGSRVYAYGLRNVQGLAWHPDTGELWVTNHGPTGEINLQAMDSVFIVQKGGNHGWPVSLGVTGMAGIVPPKLMFTGSAVPPAGAIFYTGTQMPELRNNFLFASLGAEHLARVVVGPGNQVTALERWFEQAAKSGVYGRLRAVAQGRDGAIYVTTSNRDGRGISRTGDDRILRLSAAGTPQPGVKRLPDLTPQKPSDIRIGSKGELRFTTSIANVGVGPVELQGPGEHSSDHTPQPAKQNVYGTGTTVVETSRVGDFIWHLEHNHWHFLPELALYELRAVDTTGSWQNGRVLNTGGKATFCFLDTRRVTPVVPGSPSLGRYNTCGTGIQGISVGWFDIYSYGLPGQSIDVAKIPDGIYWLVYSLDPQQAIQEARRDNNFAAQKIRLGRTGTKRTVTLVP